MTRVNYCKEDLSHYSFYVCKKYNREAYLLHIYTYGSHGFSLYLILSKWNWVIKKGEGCLLGWIWYFHVTGFSNPCFLTNNCKLKIILISYFTGIDNLILYAVLIDVIFISLNTYSFVQFKIWCFQYDMKLWTYRK